MKKGNTSNKRNFILKAPFFTRNGKKFHYNKYLGQEEKQHQTRKVKILREMTKGKEEVNQGKDNIDDRKKLLCALRNKNFEQRYRR